MVHKWKKVRFSELVSILGDGIHGTPQYDSSGECFFINGNNLSNGRIVVKEDTKRVSYLEYLKRKKKLDNRTILVSINGTIGNVAFYRGEKCILGKSVCYLNVKPDVSVNFIYYVLQRGNFQEYAKSQANGTTIKNVSLKQMRDYEFWLPSLDEQNSIASILSTLDDKIENNAAINRNLEEQAKAIFKSWFVDFEPFQDGEFIDSELGKIPKGWKINYFTDIIQISGGGTPKTSNMGFWNGTIPFFTPKDVTNSPYAINTEKNITDSGLANCNSKLYPQDSVFVTARGTVGKIAMAGSPMAMNQSCYALVGRNKLSSFFVYHLTHSVIEKLKNKANGAVFDAIVTRDFETEKIVVPPEFVIDSFIKKVSPMYQLILQNSFASNRLMQLRDTLLPKLMSGEIDVSKVERMEELA